MPCANNFVVKSGGLWERRAGLAASPPSEGKEARHMGANKTYRQKGDRGRMLGESDEFRRLRHAVEKAAGDRERAIGNVCRLYTVNRFDALPGAIRTAMLALLDETVPII
jgi:hypothetical protein